MTRAVFLVDGVRTPIARYGGALATVRPDDMAAHVIHALLRKFPDVIEQQIDDVYLGCANQAGEDNRNIARMALLLAGMPASIPGVTVNRLCASGAEAVVQGARAIACGDAELILAGGVESMTRAPFVLAKSATPFARTTTLEDTTLGWRFANPLMEKVYGLDSLTQTAENLAHELEISRHDQDAFALRSQQRAAKAYEDHFFDDELCSLNLRNERGELTPFVRDEHPRLTTLETLAQLKPLIEHGTITAGNCSGINDGAAALLLASEDAMTAHNLTPLARIEASAMAGVAPRVMGIGPVPATQKLLQRLRLTLDDFSVIEINEAFAAQMLACLRLLELDDDAEHINPNGGAIALGHPLGMSGARLVLTAARELRRRRGQRALVSLCVGLGQGMSISLVAA